MTNIIRYKPTTPSLRQRQIVNKKELSKEKPLKSLSFGLSKTGGRNNHGRITAYHRGGGHKRKYRLIDFKRSLINIPAIVQRIEYDPNRSCFIALVAYSSGELAYILAPENLKKGDIVISGHSVEIKTGNALPLKNIPLGTIIHNIELKKNKGGQLIRAAGTSAQLIKKESQLVIIRLSSGEQRLISDECFATIGRLSNVNHIHTVLGKAGASRWLGRKPTVRGVAINPVDHPHGGGEGKTSGGRPSVTPWGKPTKGKPTRKKSKSNRWIISTRKKK